MVLSFHPRVKGAVNLRLSLNKLFSKEEIELLASAHATVVTQSIKAHQYAVCQKHCEDIFPNYTHRFGFEGKYGNIQLFRKFNAPHPKTTCYESVEYFKQRHFENNEPLMPFPFVLKGDRGGGGWAVFLVENEHDDLLAMSILRNISSA